MEYVQPVITATSSTVIFVFKAPTGSYDAYYIDFFYTNRKLINHHNKKNNRFLQSQSDLYVIAMFFLLTYLSSGKKSYQLVLSDYNIQQALVQSKFIQEVKKTV